MKKFWWVGCLVGCVFGGVLLLLLWRGGHVYHGDGYAVTYPEGWQPVQFEMVDRAFVAPPRAEEQEFRSNINIVIAPGGDDISTTGETFRHIVSSLDSPDNRFTVVRMQDGMLGGRKYASLDYTFTRQGRRLQGTIYLVEAIKTYIFSYTTLEAVHPKYRDAFEEMVASLEVR